MKTYFKIFMALLVLTFASCAAFESDDEEVAATQDAEVVCGDGVIEGTEDCDDGNNVNVDGCSSTCQIEVCADGNVCYNFSGSNILQSGETDGSITGTFALDPAGFGTEINVAVAGTDWSFTMIHDQPVDEPDDPIITIEQTFASNDPDIDVFIFTVTTNASGDVTSVMLDADLPPDFIDLGWILGRGAEPRNDPDNVNRYQYYRPGTLGRVFLDTVSVTSW